ncbi:asparagine synthetase B [Nonlabens spongiae]|uniref:Asparagine synthetase B n=1 Tax=Nonlabens spongiae TaxID=331648 RepID=A0A1W6MKB6_9FLAO|nr:DUF2911 domain-containing protein [Nonlabens spongiae]ARN77919.1 asparagine synthetase B [Nonlabens spongiae]
MKNILVLGIFLMSLIGSAQEFAPLDKSPMDAAYYPANAAKRKFAKTAVQRKSLEPKIRVLYSRPSLSGRELLRDSDNREDGVLKIGEPWRLGANESTELLLMDSAMIDGQKLPAGRYTMIVVPYENEWEIRINKENDGWGNYSYESDFDVVAAKIPVRKVKDFVDELSISLYNPDEKKAIHMLIGWGYYRAELPIMM